MKRERHHDGSVTLERLERAVAVISYAIVQDGPVYAPVLERLEREIAAYCAREDVLARARRNIERLRDQAAAASVAAVGVKAIA